MDPNGAQPDTMVRAGQWGNVLLKSREQRNHDLKMRLELGERKRCGYREEHDLVRPVVDRPLNLSTTDVKTERQKEHDLSIWGHATSS